MTAFRRPTWLRRLAAPVLVLSAAALLAGCFTFENLIFLKRDGSGTVEQVVVLSGPMLEMLTMFTGEGEDALDLCKKEDLLAQAAQMGEGVQLTDSEPIEEKGRLGCRATFAFADINRLTVVQDPGEKMPDAMNEGMEADPDSPDNITFRFEPGTPSTLIIEMNQDYERNGVPGTDEALPADSTQRAMQLAMMQEMLEGGRIHIALTVDGTIVETNAAHHDRDGVTLIAINFDDLLKDEAAFKRISDARPRSAAEAETLLKDVPGVEIETSREIRVLFR